MTQFLNSPEMQELIFQLMPVIYAWTISHMNDAESFEEMCQTMTDFIHTVGEDKKRLKQLAHYFTEQLSNKDLSFTQRKTYRELLDTTLSMLREEDVEPLKASTK